MTQNGDTRTILALNSGSSSLKFGLYRVGSSKAEMLVSGEAEAIGEAGATFHAIGTIIAFPFRLIGDAVGLLV